MPRKRYKSQEWDDTGVHPTKGPKCDTQFLRGNYRFLEIGGVFRTPKARFTPRQIHAGATKAGFIVEITEEGPWSRVTVTGKLPKLKPATPASSKQLRQPSVYLGAGKVYPKTNG